MSKSYFISFSGSVGEQNEDLAVRQKMLSDSARRHANVDEVIQWTRDELLTSDFYQQNKRILDQPRGAGYWSWKPYIILQTLNKVGDNDWVVYSDIGKPFRRGDNTRAGNNAIGNIMHTPVDSIIRYADQHNGFTPGVWIPHYGAAKMWSKRDCFVGMGCDFPEYHNSGQVQAGYSCWSNSKASRAFLTQWLYWCQVEAVISDNTNQYGKPNFAEFRDHRHDQSIMTNLVIKNNILLFGPKSKSLEGFRDFNHILRHMALADQLKQNSVDFNGLFDSEKPLLPRYIKQALRLWLLPELKENSNIWVQSLNDQTRWRTALPNTHCCFGNETQEKIISNKYVAIFANQCDTQDSASLAKSLAYFYEALTPGGVLMMGPFNGTKGVKPSLDGDFSALLQWIFINQCFPSGLSTAENQIKNSITLGSAQNPYIASFNDTQCHVILRKPHYPLTIEPLNCAQKMRALKPRTTKAIL